MRKLFLLLSIFIFSSLRAQAPEKLNSEEIYQKLQKLNFLGSVLYVGAHPDDENQRLISYFSNKVHARTAYLALTRGDGGQNLIGPEIREQLGVIRTQELLAARKIDGGQQFFTRANDFGYSKNPKETLKIWDKGEVLADVVWVMRKFRPDVIINRFDHRTPGTTHGHHTSSAMLSVESFDLTDNKSSYPEQLKYTSTWQPKRLFFNTSPWFYGGQEAFEKANKSNLIKLETGVYYPLKGLSNTEIASMARSQHRSQGFGSTGSRGEQTEYLELIKGDENLENNDVFSGIETSWNRIEGGQEIGNILEKVEKEYDFTDPSASLPELLKAYSLINQLEDEHWKEIKTREIKEIIEACAGLYLEAAVTESSATPGEHIPVNLEVINRSDQPAVLSSVELSPNNSKITPNIRLENNMDWTGNIELKIPQNSDYTSPYWLQEEGSVGMYKVEDQELIGLPQATNYTTATFNISFGDIIIPFRKKLIYKYNDPVGGESYQPFEIIPPISIEFDEDMLIFEKKEPKNISFTLTASRDDVNGKLSFSAGKEWTISPETANFSIEQKGGSVNLSFSITPPAEQNETNLIPSVLIDGKEYSDHIVRIDYKHIPLQTLVLPAKLKLAKLELEKRGKRIGYIQGAGDVVPESLEQIGYQVSLLDPATINEHQLEQFDAVVLGVRAFNVDETLKFRQKILFDYVKNGGTLIVQYNTNHSLVTSDLAPFQLNLSRERVTEEDADVSFLAPEHPVLNFPNKITQKDFEGWVQERGLYFPDSWGNEFTPILSMHDQGESPKNGSLLVAPYEKGYYIYTGLSFFREFPAGVPGAFRLFTNLISIGKE